MKKFARFLALSFLPTLLFWGWNALLGFWVGWWMLAEIWEILVATYQGALPPDLAAVAIGLLLSPLLALAAWWPLRNRPKVVLYGLLFGVQLPVQIAAVFRLFFLHQTTGEQGYLLGLVAGAGALFLASLYRPREARLGPVALAAHTPLLLGALWVGASLAAYVPDVAAELAHMITRIAHRLENIDWDPSAHSIAEFLIFMFGFTLFGVGASLFIATPVGFCAAYIGAFASGFMGTLRRRGALAASLATALGVAGWLAPFGLLHDQPQHATFARLELPPADSASRAALLRDMPTLRAGLTATYLAHYRYVGTTLGKDSADDEAGFGEQVHAALTSPFLYQGTDMRHDATRAETLYTQLFDTPLQRAEREAVGEALSATWDRSSAEAGLLDVNGEQVLLTRQEVQVRATDDLAEVQIDEQYRNQTLSPQEVYYYFTLPESAAVTGLWLSDDPTDPERYPGLLAPRGAAQQVYTEQRRERRDPALLEQVGPRQFRLRAFPVLARHPNEDLGAVLTVRFTYATPVGSGGTPLPRLLERRNVFWDGRTERVGEGAGAGDAWLAASVGAGSTPKPHRAVLADGAVVTAEPNTSATPTPIGARIALVVDRSWSMHEHADDLSRELSGVRGSLAAQNDVDVYLTSGWGGASPALLEDPAAFDPATVEWFGGLDPHTMLDQYATLRGTRAYDVVLVLTDEGSYDLAARSPAAIPDTGGPLWMVHIGGRLAPAYDDALLEAIRRSHGGATTTIADVFARRGGRADGYLWSVLENPDESAQSTTDDPAFAALAAKRYVDRLSETLDMTQLDNLDAAHRVARAAHVVTPYSSLIALVDPAQKARLNQLEGDADRFDRESETGRENISAVPEPEAWALLLVGGAGIWLAQRRGRR